MASQYLNFTDPSALRKLLEFENIELRMVVDEDLHSKGYIFRKANEYSLLVGSSNLTQNALSKNKEWNIKVSSTDKGSLIEETLREFEDTFKSGVQVNEDWLGQYEQIYQQQKEKQRLEAGEYTDLVGAEAVEKQYGPSRELRPKISPNKMQVKALRGIEKVRERGETKALLISATGVSCHNYDTCSFYCSSEVFRGFFKRIMRCLEQLSCNCSKQRMKGIVFIFRGL